MIDATLQRIGEHVFGRLGFFPTDLLYQRLSRVIHTLMRQRGVASIGEYLVSLEQEGDEELERLCEALTINETYFFRELKHFDALGTLLPELGKTVDPVRILSVGCATGEEVYSLAIAASRILSGLRRRVELVGVDIDASALAKAREGLYDRWSFREDGLAQAEGYIRPEGDKLRVRSHIRQLVRFEQMNVVEHTPSGQFQVIFCRNMLMYLIPEHRRAILSHLAGLLSPGGVLFTSSTEILQDLDPALERVFRSGAYFYRRKASGGRGANGDGSIRVVMVSRSPVFRMTARRILREESGIEIVAEAAEYPLNSGRAAEPQGDLVLVDGALWNGKEGVKVTRAAGTSPVLLVVGPASGVRAAMGVEVVTLSDGDPATLKAYAQTLVRGIRAAVRPTAPRTPASVRADRVLVIGSSTGGPAAVTEVLQGIPAELGLAILVVQHMPAGFTTSFAERLDRVTSLSVAEAASGLYLQPGVAYVAPGRHNLLVGPNGILRVTPPEPDDTYVPNISRTFHSIATAGLAGRTMAVVLTGMGNDGSDGLVALASAGAQTMVQDPTEALIPGMVQAAIDRGAVSRVAKLADMPQEIARWATRAAGVRVRARPEGR